jgi:stress response protein YsnF/sporulation protein YlmC with PRC-barrel domain
MSATMVESAKNNIRIKALLEKLRNKLNNFSVLDSRGNFVGEVKDVKLDSDRQIKLLVSQVSPESGTRLFLLKSKHIQQVDSVTKSLFVDIRKTEIDSLAEYIPTGSREVESSERLPNSGTRAHEVVDLNATQASDSVGASVASGQAVSINADNTPTLTKSEERQYEPDNDDSLEDADIDVVQEEVIRLLEERLIVDRTKRKMGEVIVRKEIETRMVQVPVRYEKLIVEQVSPERKQLAEIELEGEEIPGIEFSEIVTSEHNQAQKSNGQPAVSGEFTSPKTASLFLNAIALQRHHGCAKVRVELVLEDGELLQTYQEWFNRCSTQ